MSGIHARFKINWPGFTLDVDLALPSEGVTVFFGPSGSGKTTLLRCIAGLERPPRGYLSVNGEVWQDGAGSRPTHKRPLGFVFQEASLFTHLTVLGNLEYGRKRSDAQRVSLDQAIELLGIAPLLHRKPDKLSGGERSRVGIARALAVSPRLLLMDEPLAALDHARKQEILPYLDRLHEELDIPVLYVSHAPDEVARLADHLVVLEAGRVLASGPLVETLTRMDLPIRLGEDLGVVFQATVGERDARWHLARLDFNGGHLWTRDHGVAVGSSVRVRILARDVSLARSAPEDSSIQNLLQGTVTAIADDEHPAQAIARVQVGEGILLARITQRARTALALSPGEVIWVQVKSVALL